MWKKLFKRKKMIDADKLEKIKEYLSGFSKYQWITTERAGTVTEFFNLAIEHDGQLMVEFVDGSRCNYNLLNECLIKAHSEEELPIDSFSTTQIHPEMKTNVSHAAVVKNHQPENPIHALLKKQKPNEVDIQLTITMNIPSVELYNVICGSFDNANEEIVNYVVSGLDISIIKDSVKSAIESFYSKQVFAR